MDSNPICHPSSAKKMKCLFLDYVQLLMICCTSRWTRTPSATSLQPKKWNACFWIMFNFWWSARLAKGLQPHLSPLSSQKNEMLVFVLWSTSDDQPGLLMNLNPICHPSPAKKMKCSFLYYIQVLIIGWAGQWTRTPSATPLQPKKWNAYFWIMFNFWWSAVLVDGHEPHLPPLSSQKNEMLVFGLCSTSDDRPGWPKDSNPICHPSPAKKMKCLFLYYGQLLMISQACWWTWIPSATPLQPKKWSAHFCITFKFWSLAGLVNGLEPHLPPFFSQKNEMLILDYVQLLMIGCAGRWTRTPSATPLQPKKWNACFWIMFNFWWSARLAEGLQPHLSPLSNQKNEMLIFGLCWTSDSRLGWSMDSNPIHHLSPAKEWYAHFCITFKIWSLAGLVNGLKPHLLPLSSQKNEMLIFGLCSTSDDQPGWSMDSNRICHPSPAKKMICSFLEHAQLLMIGQAGRWTQTPSTTPLQPKNEMLIFGLRSTSDDQLDWSMDSNPICHPSPNKKMICSFLY